MRIRRVILSTVLGWLALQGLPALADAPCEPVVGRIASAEGDVEIQRSGATRWFSVQTDTSLCEGDTIRAAARSRAALALVNNTVLRIDQNSAIRLVNITNTPQERSLLSLLFGGFQSLSGSKEDSRPPRPLRTQRASFPALRSSTTNASFETRQFSVSYRCMMYLTMAIRV